MRSSLSLSYTTSMMLCMEWITAKNRSRTDRIYLSDKESGRVLRHNFTDTPWKDHKIISLDLSDVSAKGPGQ